MRVEIKSKIKFKKMIQALFEVNDIPTLNGCSINSKNICKGDIFFPIKGTHFNGHDFINEALQNGASLIISEQNIKSNAAINIYVKDVVESIKNIAREWRRRNNCEIIGITGSNGKTSTKEILSKIISKSKKTMFSKGNYNSTIGLPLSMLTISEEDEFCILEMGANQDGEIAHLCKIAKPKHGLITNISNAHNQYFGNIDNIAKNKLQLFNCLPSNGYAFINMDDKYLNKVIPKSKVITYGFNGNYDYNGVFLNSEIHINGDKINLPYPNKAVAQNYLSTYSVAKTFGIESKDIIETLENTPIYSGRGEIIKQNNRTYINDTYNANLSSCLNGIDAISKMNFNKKILVLGDMHELGNQTKSEHIKLGKAINEADINAVFGLGKYIEYTLDIINSNKILTKHFKSKNELILELDKYSTSNDIVYIKGSRAMKMEEIIYNGGA